MDDPTVISICKYANLRYSTSIHLHTRTPTRRAACASKRFQLILRYNQHGVGSSSGSKSITGAADCEALPHILAYALHRLHHPSDDTTTPPSLDVLNTAERCLWIVGYSWGSCLAAHGLQWPCVAGYVAISPPIGMLGDLRQ